MTPFSTRRTACGKATALASLLAIIAPVASASGDLANPNTIVRDKLDGNPLERVYPGYFADYAVNTAADMLKYLPGVSLSLTGATSDRGLGESSGNVLVNGRKVGGKQNDALDYAERIPASNVSHIEIFRKPGTIYGLRSTGLLVNIVVKETGTTVSGVWKLSARHFRNGTVLPDGQATVSLQRESDSYSLSVEGIPRKDTQIISDIRTKHANGTRRDFEIDDTRKTTLLRVSGNADFLTDGRTSVKLNGFLERDMLDRIEAADIGHFDGVLLTPGGTRDQYEGDDRDSGEASATLVTPLGEPVDLEVIAVHSRFDQRKAETIYQDEAGRDYRIEEKRLKVRAGETILRPTLRWRLSDGNMLRFGFEGAYNSYVTGLDYALADESGVLVPQPLDNGKADIAEKRGEAFFFLSWMPIEDLTVDTGATYELSRISQVGATVDQARSLRYLKPSLRLSYRHSKKLVFKAGLEKAVGQLDFNQFVSKVDSQQEKVDSGNPDLVPQTAWNATFGVDLNLPDEGGQIRLNGFYNHISDAVEFIPFGELDSIVGNLDTAHLYGITLEGGLNLDHLGLVRDGQMDVRLTVQDSRVRDPFLHSYRPLAAMSAFAIDTKWRQNFPSLGLMSVVSWEWQSASGDYDIDESNRYSMDRGDLSASLTHTLPNNLTVSLNIENILGDIEWRARDRYLASVIDGTVKETELRSVSHGQTVRLSVQGSF